jgi:FSR family fosmidomycin resistance protein-like MFS transporter
MTRDEKMVVALTGCSHALTHGYLLIFPAVLLLLKEEFSMGYLGLGAIGNIMTFAYGLGALPGGMIYNRLGPKKLYLFCFLGSAGASLLVALSHSLILFTTGLALLGILGSVYHPLANSLITSKVSEYGRALGIHGATGNIGLAAAPFIAALIASRWGWRQAYLWFIAPGIALSIWSLFIDMSVAEKDEKKISPLSPSANSRSKMGKLWIFLTVPLLLLYLLNMLQSFSFHGATTFLPAYLAKHTSFRILSWDSVAVGGMLSSLALFMGVFGQYLGGILGQRPDLERNVLIISTAAFPFIVLMSFTGEGPLLIMALVFFFFYFALQPMMSTLLARHTALKMRGTAFGIYFFAAFGIGSLAASFSGYIAQRFGLPWVFLGLGGSVLLAIFFSFVLLKLKKPPRTLADSGG